MSIESFNPPKDGYRELLPGSGAVEFRDDAGDGKMLFGHFAVFDRWTEIDSLFEGNFVERIAPGAFKKTFQERRDMRVLLQHGRDPDVGDKPIAVPETLREDAEGAFYQARLLDGLPELVVSGLRAKQYGASFRFSVMKEDFVKDPGRSEHNPKGLPERTLRELRVPEFGPVTFPAYTEASAGLRSMTGMRSRTDEFARRDDAPRRREPPRTVAPLSNPWARPPRGPRRPGSQRAT
jgi:HK97 family phage prohead protease